MAFKLKYLKIILPILLIILFVVLVKAQNRAKCTITPAVLNTSDANGSTINFSWENGQNSKITYLNVSTSKSLKPDGSFSETADIVNDVVTDRNSYLKRSLKPGSYYWNIVSDGCRQRKVSELGRFTIQTNVNTECNPAPAILGTPVVEGSKVTLSWTSNPSVEASYINISTSNIINTNGVLQKLDVSNDIVSDKRSFTREGLSPATYYWNIIDDSCGQRKISNLGSFTVQSE